MKVKFLTIYAQGMRKEDKQSMFHCVCLKARHFRRKTFYSYQPDVCMCGCAEDTDWIVTFNT